MQEVCYLTLVVRVAVVDELTGCNKLLRPSFATCEGRASYVVYVTGAINQINESCSDGALAKVVLLRNVRKPLGVKVAYLVQCIASDIETETTAGRSFNRYCGRHSRHYSGNRVNSHTVW